LRESWQGARDTEAVSQRLSSKIEHTKGRPLSDSSISSLVIPSEWAALNDWALHAKSRQNLSIAQCCEQGAHEIIPLHMHLMVSYLLSDVWSEDFEGVNVAILVHERPWGTEYRSLEHYLNIQEGVRVTQSKS